MITIVGAESSGKTTLAMRLAEYFACPWVPEYAREYLEGLGRPYDGRDIEIISARQLKEILGFVRPQTSDVRNELEESNELSIISREISGEYREASEVSINGQLAIGNSQKIEDAGRLSEDATAGSDLDLPQKLIESSKFSIAHRPWSMVIVDGGMMNMRMWTKIKYKNSIQIVEDALCEDVTDLYLLCRPLHEWTPDPFREAPSIIDRVWIYNRYLEELSKSKIAMEIVQGEENEKFFKAVSLIANILQQDIPFME